MGVEAVAQIYNGMPTINISSMAGKPGPRYLLKISSGIKTVINPASSNPNRNHFAISSHNSPKA